MTSDLFQQLILKHYRSSRHRRALDLPYQEGSRVNPVCGDEVTVRARVQDGILQEIGFTGQGCSISQASASMMAQRIEGKTAADAIALSVRFREMLRGDAQAGSDPILGDLRALAGVAKLPQRVRCAMLPWTALEELLESSGTREPAS